MLALLELAAQVLNGAAIALGILGNLVASVLGKG